MAVAAFVCSLMMVLLVVKDVPRLAIYLLPFSLECRGLGGLYFFARSGQIGMIGAIGMVSFWCWN